MTDSLQGSERACGVDLLDDEESARTVRVPRRGSGSSGNLAVTRRRGRNPRPIRAYRDTDVDAADQRNLGLFVDV